MTRSDGRAAQDPRPISFERHFNKAAGSVLTRFGDTHVLCTASVVEGVPNWMKGRGRGWVTAEYGMLPSSTGDRKSRDRSGRVDGRSVEIQRLIGRSIRGVVDTKRMTERTIWIDCDVLQADGGTRTAAISGAWVALYDAFTFMDQKRQLRSWPLRDQLAAISVGVVDDEVLCDLCYAEDSKAEVDMNIVMTGAGKYIEVQGSAEGAPFGHDQLQSMLETGGAAIRKIFEIQKAALAEDE